MQASIPIRSSLKDGPCQQQRPCTEEAVPASQADSTQWSGSKKNYFSTGVGSGHGEQKLNLDVNLIYENLASVSTFPTKVTAGWRLRDNTKSFIQHKKGSEVLAWRLPAVGGGLCPAAGEASFSAAEKSFAVTPAPPPPIMINAHTESCHLIGSHCWALGTGVGISRLLRSSLMFCNKLLASFSFLWGLWS